MTNFKELKDSKIFVHILVCLFAISSWVDINGLWVELPILVTYLPEGWSLPSYIVIVSQVANIGPLIFVLLVFCCKGSKLEKPTSALIIVIGMVSCLLLAFFWKETTYIFGSMRATALLSLNFALALVDCTSSLAYLAFMASLRSNYLPSFFIGEGLSGMIPSLIALGQGAGEIVCVNTSQTTSNFTGGDWFNETTYNVYPQYKTPRFDVKVFFLILFGLIALSFVSFLVLNFHPYCKEEHVGHNSYDLRNDSVGEGLDTENDFTMDTIDSNGGKTPYGSKISEKSLVKNDADASIETMSTVRFVFFLVLTFLINMQITSFLLSIQSYTSLPYGLETYHLAATITNIANPLACFSNLVLTFTSTSAIFILTFLGTCSSAYLITLAVLSPEPPLVGTQAGGAIAVTAWALTAFLLTYAKVSIGGRLRRGGRKPLLWYGAATQFGALTGAVAAYVLVNVYSSLKDAPFC